ncbi:unnamed protein product (macronuclear) [Paramecium tetraurelia]|uniref:Uncharacterized protein n=1 Tax=Paramecium tetraurelia TaxID=5888 RepID=A0E6P4_PARTE|nr:uncharacterized protein GSPATT00003826001 [Paramecium tetraurelia]CAK90961.1 unnamed protein product [Paramecium tetraurelia]|eukprot:XP_001458358.1 hypothetical protein (macronuclear) [Paramecium tetraurelia strain d4-2]
MQAYLRRVGIINSIEDQITLAILTKFAFIRTYAQCSQCGYAWIQQLPWACGLKQQNQNRRFSLYITRASMKNQFRDASAIYVAILQEMSNKNPYWQHVASAEHECISIQDKGSYIIILGNNADCKPLLNQTQIIGVFGSQQNIKNQQPIQWIAFNNKEKQLPQKAHKIHFFFLCHYIIIQLQIQDFLLHIALLIQTPPSQYSLINQTIVTVQTDVQQQYKSILRRINSTNCVYVKLPENLLFKIILGILELFYKHHFFREFI